MVDHRIGDESYRDATRRGAKERASGPLPISARYDKPSGRVVVEFSNGAAFMVPARSLQHLETASDEDLTEVELLGATGLHWETLDVDFRIAGLMAGIFGTAAFMEGSRSGGASTSSAKAAAARTNGTKGRRPLKAS